MPIHAVRYPKQRRLRDELGGRIRRRYARNFPDNPAPKPALKVRCRRTFPYSHIPTIPLIGLPYPLHTPPTPVPTPATSLPRSLHCPPVASRSIRSMVFAGLNDFAAPEGVEGEGVQVESVCVYPLRCVLLADLTVSC